MCFNCLHNNKLWIFKITMTTMIKNKNNRAMKQQSNGSISQRLHYYIRILWEYYWGSGDVFFWTKTLSNFIVKTLAYRTPTCVHYLLARAFTNAFEPNLRVLPIKWVQTMDLQYVHTFPFLFLSGKLCDG